MFHHKLVKSALFSDQFFCLVARDLSVVFESMFPLGSL